MTLRTANKHKKRLQWQAWRAILLARLNRKEMMLCKCKQPATERVTNVNTGRTLEVCAPCGREWIAKGGYGGPWWYTNGQPQVVRIVSAHIEGR